MTSMDNNNRIVFVPPEYWSFRPLYTLQPVGETREKQLTIWRDLILQYCMRNNIHVIHPQSFPYFKNAVIDRQLSADGINEVVNYLIKNENAEWQDSLNGSLRIMWKSLQTLAGELYQWASRIDSYGTVFTMYELHSGEEYQDSGFHGVDPVTLRRALELLESQGKCVILTGAVAEEDGVKFLAVG